MLTLDAAPATAREPRVTRHRFAGIFDTDRPALHKDRHRLANHPPRHAIGIGIQLDTALGIDATYQLTRLQERTDPREWAQMLTLLCKAFDWRHACSAMDANIGHLPHPAQQMRFQRRPALEGVTGNGILLHVADTVFRLTLGAGSKRCADPNGHIPMSAERRETRVQMHVATHRVMTLDQCPGIVNEQRLRPASEVGKGRLNAGKPGTLPLVTECAHEIAARIAQRRHEQEDPFGLPFDAHTALPEIDLHLLARCRFETHRGAPLRLQLLAKGLAGTLYRAQPDDNAQFLLQLLTHHIAIAAMLDRPLTQPGFMTVQNACPLWCAIRQRPTCIQIAPHRITCYAQFPGDALPSPSQLIQPNDRSNRLRLQHLQYSAMNTAYRIALNLPDFHARPP